ncbi:MAG TPA: coproporphyrinogen III oxidase, partial [Terriglobia bacterium]|nr:coproporphyrinogen III oxidase [Terriglobia bacterium]
MDRTDFISFIHAYQDHLCKIFEGEDGHAKFSTDKWERADGGGGITRIIENGRVIEKGGVNTSVVHGKVTPSLEQQLQ